MSRAPQKEGSERPDQAPEIGSLQEWQYLRTRVIEVASTRPDLQYSLEIKDGKLHIPQTGFDQAVKYIALVNTIPIDDPTPLTLTTPLLSKPSSDDLGHLLIDFPDAALQLSLVQKMIKLMNTLDPESPECRQVATHALKIGSPIARFYEIPELIANTEDKVFAILWPSNYRQAITTIQEVLNHQPITPEILKQISDEIQNDIHTATNIDPENIFFLIRQKGVLATWLKHFENRSSVDIIAVTASFADLTVDPNDTLADARQYDWLKNIVFALNRIKIGPDQRPKYKFIRNESKGIPTDAESYEALHNDYYAHFATLTESIQVEFRVNTWTRQWQNLARHPAYKGITPSHPSIDPGDPIIYGMIADANIRKSIK
ncbi:hypothetical protein HYV64_04175 [Candidatus Shapirobacteria bacterium]|nr:hypothetical protein [Candidatus Shapirobacteria bacterium]